MKKYFLLTFMIFLNNSSCSQAIKNAFSSSFKSVFDTVTSYEKMKTFIVGKELFSKNQAITFAKGLACGLTLEFIESELINKYMPASAKSYYCIMVKKPLPFIPLLYLRPCLISGLGLLSGHFMMMLISHMSKN